MTTVAPVALKLDEASLFLDLDGTLAPFALRPDAVGPDAERNGRLRRLAERMQGRLAVVSGRSVEDLDRILENAVAAVAGSHGLQRRDARGRLRAKTPHPNLTDAVAEIRAFADRFPDVIVETKPLSVAFHYRGNPSVAPVAQVFADDLAERTGLKLQKGDMVAEFLTPGGDKGEALRAFMAEPPFSGTVPLFVGDDLTDEDGFAAAQLFSGFGILAGATRATRARFRLDGAPAVHAWLERALKDNCFVLENFA